MTTLWINTELGVELRLIAPGLYYVRYGASGWGGLSYGEAACELGRCIMESLKANAKAAEVMRERQADLEADLHKRYSSYQDECERANKFPLHFHAWRVREGI